MGFFKRSVPSEKTRTALTIIAKNNKISGDLIITGKIHIDGYVEGNITSVEDITIGKTGLVQGVINAKHVTVSGIIEGEVYCQHLHIAPGGRVLAKVESAEMTMDSKSHFTGQCKEIVDSDLSSDELKAKYMDLASAKTSDHSLIKEEIDFDSLNENKPSIHNADVIDNLPDKITLSAIDANVIKPSSNRFKPTNRQSRVDKDQSSDSLSFEDKLDERETASKTLSDNERGKTIALQEDIGLGLEHKKSALDVKNNEVANVIGSNIQKDLMKTSLHVKKVVVNSSVNKPENGNINLQASPNELQEKSFSKSLLSKGQKIRVKDLKSTTKATEQVQSKIVDENTTKLELKF
ncbi:MAG: cytoskeletal protein CcmA (bactofilin family) [Oceanospirillaceae bacterium]|jgi:cytoskeletal protein CcmA (bactofilin family)